MIMPQLVTENKYILNINDDSREEDKKIKQ